MTFGLTTTLSETEENTSRDDTTQVVDECSCDRNGAENNNEEGKVHRTEFAEDLI
jgi:hypothetical protein